VHDGIESRLAALGCYLDESDPDIVVLRRQDGSFVAAFSATGATEEDIVEAAKDDYRTVTQELACSQSGRDIERPF
jgi:hypothetical protein